jgi:glycosyltransferase involved in cell wall biosynthesis
MKNILFIAPTNYALPINETLKKKFLALSDVCNVRVLAFADINTTMNEEYGKFFLYKKIKNRLINYLKIIQISIFVTPNIIKKENIDIVCYQDPVSSFFSIFFLKIRSIDVKIIVETHGDFIETLSLEKNLLFPNTYKRFFYLMAKYSFNKCDKVRAVSSSTEQQVIQISPSKDIVRFPAWVDFKDFEEIDSTIVNHDKFNILFIGSVTDRKKPHMIIEAINSLQDKNINLSIVGPTPNEKYLEELKDLIVNRNLSSQITLIGSVDREKVKEFYKNSSLMVLPSISEGLARVIFESQVASCPVLVTDAPGMSDIVIDGQTGYMFESNNLESLSEKMAYIKANYEEVSAIAKNAKNFILSNYSEDNFKFSFKKLFDTV